MLPGQTGVAAQPSRQEKTLTVYVSMNTGYVAFQRKKYRVIPTVSTCAAVEAGFGVWVSRLSRQIVDTFVEGGGDTFVGGGHARRELFFIERSTTRVGFY